MSRTRPWRRSFGVTLIELMITVAVVAILAAVAIPSYNSYVVKANRRSAQAAMMDMANLQQQYLLSNRTFASKSDLVATGFSLPSDVSARYTFDVSLGASGPPSFTITLTPISGGSQSSDGALTLDNLGVKSPLDKW